MAWDPVLVTAIQIIHVDKALGRCGYLKWSFKRVRGSMDKTKWEEGVTREQGHES